MNEQYSDNLDQIEIFPSGKLFRIVFDSAMNQLRIVSKNIDCFNEIRNAFSVENKAAFFTEQYGYKGEARLYSINKFGYFKSGLIGRILTWIKDQYGSLNCLAVSQNCLNYINDFVKPLQKTVKLLGGEFNVANISEDTGINDQRRMKMAEMLDAGIPDDQIRERPFEFRHYQSAAIEKLITKGFGRGLIEIPTSGGKSFILANFAWNILKKVNKDYKFMLLVPNVQLVEQMYKDFVDYGFPEQQIAKFMGGMSKKDRIKHDPKKAKIVIANRQFIFKNMKLLPEFDVLMADECHQNCAPASQQLIDNLKAKIKIGCSGTLPADKYKLEMLIGMFGEIVYRENVTDLQNEGFISKLDIDVISVCDKNVEADRSLLFNLNTTRKYNPENPDDIQFDDAVKAEHDYFVKWYKELYKPVLDYVNRLNGNTLVLFDKLDIGTNLFEFYRNQYGEENVFYNDGQTKIEERERMRSDLEKSDGNVLFANVQIMSTGINIKRLHNIVFCFSSKSTVRVVQSIGRVLRLYNDKERARLIDCVFNFKYSKRHYQERLRLYKQFYNKSKPDKIIQIEI